MTSPQWGALPTPVVMRSPAWARFVSVPLMAAFWVGCLFGLYGLVTHGAGDDVPWLAAAVAWVLVLFFVVILPIAAYGILTFRLTLSPDRIERRPGRTNVAVSDLSQIRALPAATINRANRGARVQMLDAHGGVVAQIEESAARWEQGREMARFWVARNPALVTDDYTRERLLSPGG